jgi:hypothetical protein
MPSEKILGGHAASSDTIEVLVENDTLVFHVAASSAAAP